MGNRLLIVAVFAVFCGVGHAAVWDGTANVSWYNESQSSFTITTAEQLAGFAQLVNEGNGFEGKTIILGNNIELNDISNLESWATSPPSRTWTAIGTSSSSFSGTFDGDRHTISGVYINNNLSYQGLFGYVENSTIKNIGIVSSYVKGHTYVGNLVGYSKGSTISYSYATGNVATITSGGCSGGLVGNSMSSTINNSYATGMVAGTGIIGGLVGKSDGSRISYSYATGMVTGMGNIVGIGGLVGINNSNSQISNSYATGTVTTTSASGQGGVGGLVGSNFSSISNSYATGAGTSTLVIGGLVGFNNPGITISNSYYDKETTGKTDTGKGTGKTTDEMKMQSTYESWDFNYVWGINESYPYLLVPVESIVLGIDTSIAYYGDTITFSATVYPEKTRKNIRWSVDNSKASISGDSIAFKAAGSLEITAAITNGLGIGQDYDTIFTINVKKATPTNYTTPTGLTATYGQKLSEVSLTDCWSWMDNTDDVGNVGTREHFAKFTPSDTNNYNIISDIKLSVEVTKAKPSGIIFPTTKAITYNPNAKLSNNLFNNDGQGAGTFAWKDSTVTPTVNNNGYNVVFSPSNSANYDTLIMSVALTVNKATPSYTIPTGLTAIYGQKLEEIDLTDTHFSWASPTSPVGDARDTPQTHQAIYTPDDLVNYKVESGFFVGIKVSKAEGATLSKPILYSKTSSSITIKAITANTGQEVEYARNGDNVVPSSPDAWNKINLPDTTLSFSVTTVSKEYYIFARAIENNNYKQGAVSTLPVWIDIGTSGSSSSGIDGSSSSGIGGSSSSGTSGSSSSGTDGNSSSGGAATYKYCVFSKGRACLSGSYETCPAGGQLSDDCPYLNNTPIKPINPPQISTNIKAKATTNAIILENLPKNSKVEVYNLQGKRIYSAYLENPKILTIEVQTKGMYIVKVSNRVLRVMVM